MKFMKQFSNITAAFVLAVFLPFPIQAAEEPLQEIILDFCQEVKNESQEALDEYSESLKDIQDCGNEFNDCQSGFRNESTISCLTEVAECGARGIEDVAQTCAQFSDEISDAYEKALRQARRQDVENEFQEWLVGGVGSKVCLAPPTAMALICALRTTASQ